MPPAPPVVVPNSGNNIIVNPCQVCPNPSNWGELLNALVLERKPSPGMHPKRRERIRGHCGRLSGWEYDRSLVSEVNGPAYRCWRFLIHPACDITVSILNISSHALRSLAVHMTAVSCWYSVTSYVCHLFFFQLLTNFMARLNIMNLCESSQRFSIPWCRFEIVYWPGFSHVWSITSLSSLPFRASTANFNSKYFQLRCLQEWRSRPLPHHVQAIRVQTSRHDQRTHRQRL